MWLEVAVSACRSGRNRSREAPAARTRAGAVTSSPRGPDPVGTAPLDPEDARVLVDLHPRFEQPAAQPVGQPGGLDRRRGRVEGAGAEQRSGASLGHRLAIEQLDAVAHAELLTCFGGRAPRAVEPRRRRSLEIAAAVEPGVDALLVAPAADRANGILGRLGHRQRRLVPEVAAHRRQAEPERVDEAAVAAARAEPAAVRLEQDDAGRRLGLLDPPGGPHTGVAATDDHDVGARVPVQRRAGGAALQAGLVDPVAVRVVTHPAQVWGTPPAGYAGVAAGSATAASEAVSAARALTRSISSCCTWGCGSSLDGTTRSHFPFAVEVPAARLVGEAHLEDLDHLRPHRLVEHRHRQLDPVEEVARHQVGRAREDALLAVALEEQDPRVLEEAAEHRLDPDVLGDSRDPGADRADPANVEVHLNARLRCPVEGLDHRRVEQRVHLHPDPRGVARRSATRPCARSPRAGPLNRLWGAISALR